MRRLVGLGGLLAALVWLAGCGDGKPPFASKTVTLLVGSGEKADEPQALVSAVESVAIDGQVVLARLPATPSGERWVLKQTAEFTREVTAGTKGALTIAGPRGTETVPLTFSDSLIPRTAKHRLWGQEVQVQCYVSVGSKWGLVIRVVPAP